MLTLDEASDLQRKKERKILIKFFVLLALWALLLIVSFRIADTLTVSRSILFIPSAAIIGVFALSGITKLFAPKEFVGKIISIHVFATRDKVVKGAGRGNGPNVTKLYNMSEIIAESENGKSIICEFRNGDAVSQLSEGDVIAVLRLVDEPIIITKYSN